MRLGYFCFLLVVLPVGSVEARNIVISNDDGLTSNVKALYEGLKAEGHDVIVSVPCSNQSGMGGAIQFARPLGVLTKECRNDAAQVGDPGAGPMTRSGFAQDFFYVDGTPVMSLLYGLDVVAAERWGKAPDLVLSGPNEGQNIGSVVVSSGTVSNVQYAAGRSIPALALSASANTADDAGLANGGSRAVAKLVVDLVRALDEKSGGGALLPAGVALNVNFPNELDHAGWKLSRIGTYEAMRVSFAADRARARNPVEGLGDLHGPGILIESNTDEPARDQQDDEAAVVRKDIAVSILQSGYDAPPATTRRLQHYLKNILKK